jgi:hypothetical protein
MTVIVDSSPKTTTALDIIKSSLRLLQVLASDMVLTDSEANDALDCLNLILADAWPNESLMVSHITKEQFPLVSGKNPYTIGIGGDFNTSRPISIEMATINIGGADYPVQQLAFDDWAAVRLKSLATGYVEYFYVDETYPLSNLYIYPIWNSATPTNLTLYSRKPFSAFNNLTDTVIMQPGAVRALKYQLAVELAPEYQTTAGDDVKRLLSEAKAAIKRTNKRAITSQVDPGLFTPGTQRFNIYRGS